MAAHKGAEHHHKSAEHHEHAARHHREAAKHHEGGDHERAVITRTSRTDTIFTRRITLKKPVSITLQSMVAVKVSESATTVKSAVG
jgi:predicted DNA repair protein MutK